MARFLSREWFGELREAERGERDGEGAARAEEADKGAGAAGVLRTDVGGPGGEGSAGAEEPLVIEVLVTGIPEGATGAPEGEVRYQVMVEGTRARTLSPEAASVTARVKFSGDYATMAGIASGTLSALDALSAGRARVAGDISALSARSARLAGLDLLPSQVRASTEF